MTRTPGLHGDIPFAACGPRVTCKLARALQSNTIMDSKPRHSVLTVARVGAVLVDIESGLTLGSYARQLGAERRETDNDPHLTDLPSVVPEPRTKSSRNK